MSEKMSRRERLMQRQQNSGKVGGGFQKVFNVPEGVSKYEREIETMQTFGIVPFVVTSKAHPEYDIIMKEAKEYNELPVSHKLDFWVHNVPGMNKEVICHNLTYGKHSCPICAERQRLLDEGHEWDSKEVKPYSAKRRVAYVVCNMDNEENPLEVLEGPYGWIGKVIDEKAAEQNVLLLDESENGKNIQMFSMEHTFKTNKGEDMKMAGKISVKFLDRPFGFNEEDMAEIDLCSFLTVDSEEDIYNAFHAIDGEDSGDEEDEEIIDTKPASRANRGTATEGSEQASATTVREPNTSSRRGRGGAPEASETPSTPRGRARGRGASTETFTEDEITF